ncbi:MAG TPA: hypothetical protein VLL52_04560 [Anaerolineae bacterium]|nr:hypothetical protein [Anaerolineae bacterium]
MSRVININNPTKIRNQNRRTIAEILRHLLSKGEVDAETKDMAACITFCLHEIDKGLHQTVAAWEKRGYWMKAERFLRDWQWVSETAANFDDVIRADAWDLLPELLADLFPRFTDIQVKNMTRPASTWQGQHKLLLSSPPIESPW